MRNIENRRRVLEIYGNECANKGDPRIKHTFKRRLTFHHIVFQSEGGTDEKSNLIPLCRKCHDFTHELAEGREYYLDSSGKKRRR